MIIILNGPQNTGKSTVAKLLQNEIPQTAHIEVDKIRHFYSWMEGEDAFPLSIENAVLVAKNLVGKGLNVIMTYVFSEKELKNVLDELKNLSQPIHLFTFNPDKEVALTNRGTRELLDREKERIKYHYSVGINEPSIGVIIDNTHETPEETKNKIMEYVQKDISKNPPQFKVRKTE